MRVVLDRDRCDGHGLCASLCPEVFSLTDDDELVVAAEQPAAELHGRIEAAARACPKAAISLMA